MLPATRGRSCTGVAGPATAVLLLVSIFFSLGACRSLPGSRASGDETSPSAPGGALTLNHKADGFRGIWYMNQPLDNKYRFKYSGGLATYTAKHRPFAVYSQAANKTFFVYGGTTKGFNQHIDVASEGLADTTGALLHIVSYYDHATGEVARPTILLDKKTWDAHDNPVISLDDDGYIWVFSTSHGRSRPSYIHRSTRPYDINRFERVRATRKKGERRVAITNFSYLQAWHLTGKGFFTFFTRYDYPVNRTPAYMTSQDGARWSAW